MSAIQELIKKANTLNKHIESLNQEYNELKEKIQKYFDKKDIKTMDVDNIHVVKSERLNITYNAEMLELKLKNSTSHDARNNKEIINEVIVRAYSIVDYDGLVTLLKRRGVRPGEFKEHVRIVRAVDKKALNKLFEVGDLDIKQLEGCYEATITKSISIKEKQGD